MTVAGLPGWLTRIDWRVRCTTLFVVASGVAVLALAGAGLWHRPRFDIAAGIIIAGCLTAIAFQRTRGWLACMDWRIAAIVLTTALSVAATCLGFDLGWDGETGGRFPHDVFAGWVASIAFFGTIGLVVAVVSLVQPEKEGFESRARILLRGKDGEHIRYIIERLRGTLEHYAEEVTSTIIIKDYDAIGQKFFIRMELTTVLRSYLDDIETRYESEFEIEQETDPPANQPPARLIYLRVGKGEDQQRYPSRPFQNNGIREVIRSTIRPRGTCPVESAVEVWVKADTEANNHKTVRFTQRMQLRVRNNLPGNETVRIRFNEPAGQRPDEHSLKSDGEHMRSFRDLRPRIQAYDFTILTLT
ncbi:MAG: hypothetical protein ABI369_10185 [Acetobacteraceae bacterium]